LFLAAHQLVKIALDGDGGVHYGLIIAIHKVPPLKRQSAASAGKADGNGGSASRPLTLHSDRQNRV
jgi:hypothetical protein